MKRRVPLPRGGLEYAVLATVWDPEEASVREIQERVGQPSKLEYAITAKVLDRLHIKGLVSREPKEQGSDSPGRIVFRV